VSGLIRSGSSRIHSFPKASGSSPMLRVWGCGWCDHYRCLPQKRCSSTGTAELSTKTEFLVLCLLCVLSVRTTAAEQQRYNDSQPHMGTIISITLYAASPEHARQAFAAAFRRVTQLDQILS